MSIGKFLPRILREALVGRAVRKALEKAGLPKAAVGGIMKGWKTWAGGLALIGAGIATAASEIASGSFNLDAIMKGVAMIGGGFTALGLGHKQDKNTAAIKENTAAVVAPGSVSSPPASAQQA